jgi:hypothetical protein
MMAPEKTPTAKPAVRAACSSFGGHVVPVDPILEE